MLSGWVRSGRGGRAARCRRIRPTITLDITRGLQTDSRKKEPYAATLKNLQIGSHTRVIVQGFTGRNATANSQESIDWGTNIVGGVIPYRKPSTPDAHLGRPLFPSVRAAVDAVRPDATAVYVPAHRAAAAIEEAIAAEVPLVVAVAEHIPVHDMVRVHQVLRTQDKSRLVGPNSPGLLNVNAACRIGFQPLSVYAPGCVGLVAKSGTLSYEAAAATTRAGLGQSLCVGVGGDVLPGTDLDEALAAVLADDATRAVALMGELGGGAEVRAAAWLEEYYRGQAARGEARKPVAFLLAGYDAPRDRVMYVCVPLLYTTLSPPPLSSLSLLSIWDHDTHMYIHTGATRVPFGNLATRLSNSNTPSCKTPAPSPYTTPPTSGPYSRAC